MNRTVDFFTDTATLAIFDPGVLDHRLNDEGDWWVCYDAADIEEVRSGMISLFNLEADGSYQFRITDEDLTPTEREYAALGIQGLGLKVTSGTVIVGPGECLPGSGNAHDSKRGTKVSLADGLYRVETYAIYWQDSPHWWNEGGERHADAPPDAVIRILPREGRNPPLAGVPDLFSLNHDDFLIESASRKIGPETGMTLTTKVRKGPNGLVLKECGPCYYTATLEDYSTVKWQDTIRFRVVTVDHEAKSMIGAYVETIDGDSQRKAKANQPDPERRQSLIERMLDIFRR